MFVEDSVATRISIRILIPKSMKLEDHLDSLVRTHGAHQTEQAATAVLRSNERALGGPISAFRRDFRLNKWLLEALFRFPQVEIDGRARSAIRQLGTPSKLNDQLGLVLSTPLRVSEGCRRINRNEGAKPAMLKKPAAPFRGSHLPYRLTSLALMSHLFAQKYRQVTELDSKSLHKTTLPTRNRSQTNFTPYRSDALWGGVKLFP